MNTAVEQWKKRFLRKAKLYLYRHDPEMVVHYINKGQPFNQYIVIWEDFAKDKVKIGGFHDYMHCRYGPSTYGTLTGESVTGLWQSKAGSVDEEELAAMIAVAQGVHDLPEFDLDTLQGLQW